MTEELLAGALLAVLSYRLGWSRGARKMSAAMAGRITLGQKWRMWAAELVTPPREHVGPSHEEILAQLRRQWTGSHVPKQPEDTKEDAHGAGGVEGQPAARTGQYL